MLHTDFNLNTKNARAVGGSSYITASGAYIGVINTARLYETKNGAGMLSLEFESKDGEKAHISYCLYKSNGEETFARAILDALMTVCRVKTIKATQGKYKDRSGNEQSGYFFTELQKKPLGMLLQAAPEEFLDNQTGTIKTIVRMNLLTPFDATTRQNAAEILDQAEAKAVDSRLKTLKDKALKKLPMEQAAQQLDHDVPPSDYSDVPF